MANRGRLPELRSSWFMASPSTLVVTSEPARFSPTPASRSGPSTCLALAGSGGPRGDIADWSVYHEQIERHLGSVRSAGVPVVLFGHSMGGTLAAGYVISGRPSPDLLVLSAPAFSGGAGWQRVLATVGARVAPTVSIPNSLKGEQLSRDPAVGEAYFSDPMVWRKTTPRLGSYLFTAMADITAGATTDRRPHSRASRRGGHHRPSPVHCIPRRSPWLRTSAIPVVAP